MDGAYAGGSHYTGIKGIRELIGADPQRVNAIVRDATHGFTRAMISDEALQRLALFVTRGQHETDWYIDFMSKRARGDVAKGERFFQNICAACHGFDGRAINFKTDDNPEYGGRGEPLGDAPQDPQWPAGRAHAGHAGDADTGCGRYPGLQPNVAGEIAFVRRNGTALSARSVGQPPARP